MSWNNSFIVIMICFAPFVFSQEGHYKPRKIPEKIAELEKIKLIETLNLNEETTLRFFARRNEFQKKTSEIENEIELKLDELSKLIAPESNAGDENIKPIIDEVNYLRKKLAVEKENFLNSITDILTYKQIAGLIVFEKKFREELKNAIFRERRQKKMQ